MNQDFETLRDELERSLGGLDDLQTQLRSGGDAARWSIQQIVGHLLLTYGATERAMDARLEKGTPTKARPTLPQRVGQFLVIRLERFPPGRQAPEPVAPAAGGPAVPGGVLIAQVDEAITKLDRKLVEAERVFGPKTRAVSHMVLGPLSIWQWRRFHLVHGRHHVKQIMRIRAEFGV
jgi:hypothetical protein